MKVKIRISHFTTKNIKVNTSTKPQQLPPKIVPSKLNQIKKRTKRPIVPKKPPTGIKLERISLKKEAYYASIPKRQESEVINCIIEKEVSVFRNIK